ncbi:hypothetical protein DH2020_023547 [Rehmannia glutinosa]|uniref:BRCT domain-containing protein n=1 Tax=Rehmannia glutinosa TaxID=99300 RepID=A0ABR0W847_REHGL
MHTPLHAEKLKQYFVDGDKSVSRSECIHVRNLVPPELFDALHDALKLNGAQVFLCCDPSRNGPNDYHVIASPEHEKFDDLRSKGCNLIGPQCVLSCAKEHRVLPNQGFTCCLAMDGVNILASGFEKDEKGVMLVNELSRSIKVYLVALLHNHASYERTSDASSIHDNSPLHDFNCSISLNTDDADIAKMVTAMGGVLHTKASSDVSFVIAKNVLAQKYKVCMAPAGRRVYGHTWASSFCQPIWVEVHMTCLGKYISVLNVIRHIGNGEQWALNNLKKPIVSSNWLVQCWKEHRVVPQESYKVLPFSGLTICVSGIPADERKEVEKLVMQNGGKYSAELTKRCTHLVCDISFVFSLLLCILILPTGVMFHLEMGHGLKSECANQTQNLIQQENHTYCMIFTIDLLHLETTISRSPEYISRIFDYLLESWIIYKGNDPPADEHKNDSDFARCIADDSQCEDDDLYLSECRILLVGFEASELRKLVDMVRQGGGSRYMSFNQKLTHVVVGNPSETYLITNLVEHGKWFCSEIKEVRSLAALGVIYIVITAWLEECTFRKKEVPVLKSHIAYDLLLPKDPLIFNKTTGTSMTVSKQGKSSISQPVDSNILEHKNSQFEVSFGLGEEVKLKVQTGVGNGIKHTKSSTVFKGKLFRFSSSFPREQQRRHQAIWYGVRYQTTSCFSCIGTLIWHWNCVTYLPASRSKQGANSSVETEIVLWVNEGGGEVVANQNEKNVHFIVERHGEVSSLKNTVRSTYVTTHWIYSCLEDGCLLDVSSHILYSPLSCQIPLPGFERYRICVSRYDMKERQLLRNLCYVLGAKFIDKLTRKVTHLLCKFADGDKYEAACRWGIHVVTAEWIYECAMQNKVADLARFHPKGLTSQDQQAGLYSVSQYPSQSVRMTSGDDASQHPSLLQDMRNMLTVASTGCMARDEENYSSSGNKRARVLGNDSIKRPLSCEPAIDNSVNMKNPTENNVTENTVEVSVVPDVAAAIEDLLEQTSKIQDRKSPETSGCHENFLFSNPTMLGQSHVDPQSIPGPSKHWMNRIEKRDDNPSADAAATVLYDGFSETQTDSQVVGYEEDLTGRQMIIDRVRTRSSMP